MALFGLAMLTLAPLAGCRSPSAAPTAGAQAQAVPGAETPPSAALAGARRLSLGEAAPDIDLPVFESAPGTSAPVASVRLRLADYAGRPLVVNFWATWCAPCVVELPLLEAAAAAHRQAGLAVLALDLRETREEVDAFLRQRPLDLPVGLDLAGETAYLYRVQSLPTSIFVDRDGRVVDFKAGAFRDAADLDQSLAQILP